MIGLRTFTRGLAWIALFAGVSPAIAQSQSQNRLRGYVAIDHAIGTADDYVRLFDLSTLERSGQYARGVAHERHVAPFVDPRDGQSYTGKFYRVFIDCARSEVRELRVRTLFDTGGPISDFDAVQPRKLPATAPIFASACGRAGRFDPPFPLYNSDFQPSLEKREVRYKGARDYPWPDLGSADQALIRARSMEVTARENAKAGYWLSLKPVPFITVRQGYYAADFSWKFYKVGNGEVRLDRGWVDLGKVFQLADDLYFYEIVMVGEKDDTPRMIARTSSNLGHYAIGVEVRCKSGLSQRISAMEYHSPVGPITTEPVPYADMRWRTGGASFSRLLCARRFDASAYRLPTVKAAVDRMHYDLRAKFAGRK